MSEVNRVCVLVYLGKYAPVEAGPVWGLIAYPAWNQASAYLVGK
jgi:hypothetical protein